MKLLKLTYLLIILINLSSCTKEKSEVIFDTSFSGARLDSIIKLNDNSFEAIIKPAFEPVNKSPWFAFSVSSDSEKNINVVLNYGKYKHRYIPKLSTDRKNWRKIDNKNIEIDTAKGTAKLTLNVIPNKLFVAAQEIESSKDTYLWMDSLVTSHSQTEKIVAGKTVLNKNLYCLELKNDSTKNAIALIARQHPPEIPGGTIGFKAFYETLLSNSDLATKFRKHFNIYTFPLFNPDGADLGNWRHNSNGVDLNRDWIDFTQKETKIAKTYFENKVKNGQKLKFAIDFHTSYSGPYLLVLDSINEQKTEKIVPNWITNIEKQSSFEVETRRRSQELPYCYNYFFNEFGCESVTYEEGDEVDRIIIKERAQVYANELMKTLIKKINNNEFKE